MEWIGFILHISDIGEHHPVDCSEVPKQGNGVYNIYPNHSSDPVQVFCNQAVSGGGWLVSILYSSIQ